MIYLLTFFTGLIFTIFLTPYVINYLTRVKVLDEPGERKIHTSAVPRMGGLLIYIIVVVTFFAYSTNFYETKLIIFSSSIIILCGIWDDTRGLKWFVKFILQFVSAGLLMFFLGPAILAVEFLGYSIPPPFDYIILMLFIVGVINSVNMMDGMDGLVTGFSILMFMIIWALAYSTQNNSLLILTSALVGSTIGFLKFNAFPAKIFLGDTGSLMLGFFLVLCSLMIGLDMNSARIDLSFLIIMFGVPVIDTLKVMSLRIYQKHNPFLPDKSHLHHIIFGANVRHKTTVFLILAFTLLFMLTGFYYLMISKAAGVMLFLLFGIMLLMIKSEMRFLQDTIIHKFYANKLLNTPSFLVLLFKRLFMQVSAVTIFVLMAFLLPGRSEVESKFLVLLFLVSLALLITAFYQNRQSRFFNDVYVFINIILFVILSQKTLPLISELNVNGETTYLIIRVCFLLLLGMVTFFIITKERLIGSGKTLLSGIDLVIVVIISLMLLLQNFLPNLKDVFDGGSMALGFVFYLWYKIFVLVKEDRQPVLFYLSFMLPISSIILMYTFS